MTIVNVGKDEILQTLGGIITGTKFNQIGVGNSSSGVTGNETNLLGTSTYWQNVLSTDTVYVRPNLILTVTLGYNSANFQLNEYGVKDSNNVLVSRYVDPAPLTKNSSQMVMVSVQFSM